MNSKSSLTRGEDQSYLSPHPRHTFLEISSLRFHGEKCLTQNMVLVFFFFF